MSFAIHPEFTSEQNRWTCFEGVLNASCYADSIVAISNYSRESFLEIFPHYPSDRVRVVLLGSRFSSPAEDQPGSVVAGLLPDKFWLAVGTLEPRKNVRRLLGAYAAFISRNQEGFPLVLAGGKGWLEDDLEEFINMLGIREHTKILGYVTDDELTWLYRNCFAFTYPSLFEGFGLPVLEALSLGAAVVTSNTTSLPEVAGDAACYVDPLKEEAIIAAMSRLTNDEGYRMKLKGLSKPQALKFSWKRCASEILEIYGEVIKRPKLERSGQK
jgi:glycosyltransferase involved in cell wall biosynthesis